MTVRELRKRLELMPDEAEIGTADDFGDIEDIYYVAEPTSERDYVRLYIRSGAVVDE